MMAREWKTKRWERQRRRRAKGVSNIRYWVLGTGESFWNKKEIFEWKNLGYVRWRKSIWSEENERKRGRIWKKKESQDKRKSRFSFPASFGFWARDLWPMEGLTSNVCQDISRRMKERGDKARKKGTRVKWNTTVIEIWGRQLKLAILDKKVEYSREIMARRWAIVK